MVDERTGASYDREVRSVVTRVAKFGIVQEVPRSRLILGASEPSPNPRLPIRVSVLTSWKTFYTRSRPGFGRVSPQFG